MKSTILALLLLMAPLPALAAPSVAIAAPNASASEIGTKGTFRITRSGSTAASLTVALEVSGTANRNVDYTLSGGGLTPSGLLAVIPAGAAFVDLTVSPKADSVNNEGQESVVVTLAPRATYNLATRRTATVTISDALTFAKPNILVILTDDQTEHMITGLDAAGRPFMPFLRSKLPSARRFDTAIYSQSLCCPSRTSLLTGMYPQNHGVTNNHAITGGGYEGYMARELDKESWSKLLQPDYYTGFFGKFLNGYLNPASVPVGWDRWYAVYAGAGNMFNWSASHNGIPVVYRGSTDATYSTNVLANLVSITIKQQPIVYKRPFALLFAPIAPHLPARPALEFKGRYAFEPFAPKLKPSFNEPDVSDKPSHIQALPQFTAEEIAVLERDWRLMLESGLSIDKAFQTIWKTLEATGQLANTYIVFASDNGYLWGEHRISNKLYPYRESIKSTMLVWGPGVVPGLDHHIVTNADLFPTFMEIAGKPIPDWVDGRSLLALLRGLTPATWRWQLLVHGNPAESAGRDFHALATGNWTFVQHATEKEFYDLLADPYEVNNAAAALPAAFVTEVEARITNLYNCKGTAVCQPIEDAPLPVR